MSVQKNFSSPQEFEIVEYPGKVVNEDKMIATLGGISKISQTFGGEQKRLELRFHPDNPFNKAACADMSTRAGLLLSVKVRRSKRNPSRAPQYSVCILGHCERSFTFDTGMCDFQFLPMWNKSGQSQEPGQTVAVLKELLPQSVNDIEYFKRSEVPLLCVPQLFARSDVVHSSICRSDSQENGQHDVLGVLQKSTYDTRDMVPFSMMDAFPTRPDPQIVKRMKVKYVSDEQLERVKKLFDDCPIWTRIALLHESGVTKDKLKWIIPSLAYYFSTGPWRTFFVRYGYDPRKDFNSRHYQTFDFRLRFRSGVAEFVSNRKNFLKKRQENTYELNALEQDIDYPYLDENRLPRARQCILRYCDIRMPKVQEMLEKIPSPLTGAMCNERTGWLPLGFDGQVRQIVSNSIMELLRNHYRKEQILAELDAVENVEQEGEDDEEEESDASDTNDFLAETFDGILEDMQTDSEVLS